MKKRTKKLVSMLLTTALASSCLMGCAGEKKASETAAATQQASNTADGGTTAENGKAEGEKPLKVAFINSMNLGSQAFADVVWHGVETGAKKHGYECSALQGIEVSAQADSAAAAISEGINMIFYSGESEAVFTRDFVSRYPDVIFCDVDATGGEYAENVPNNMYVTAYKEHEAAFLNAVFAVKMSKSGQVALIQGSDSGTQLRFNTGFRSGVMYEAGYDPNTVSVGMSDVNKGYETASMLNKQGVDVFACCAGGSNLGVFQAADELGFLACGAADGQFHLMPSVIPASQVKTVDKVCEELIDSYAEGNFPYGKSDVRGVAEGGVALIYTDKNEELLASIPQEVIDHVEDVRQKIISGEITVPATYEELEAFTLRAE